MAGLLETMAVRSQNTEKINSINPEFLMPQNYLSKMKTYYRFLQTNEHRIHHQLTFTILNYASINTYQKYFHMETCIYRKNEEYLKW